MLPMRKYIRMKWEVWRCVAISNPAYQGANPSQLAEVSAQDLLAAASRITAFGRSGDYVMFTLLLVLSVPYWSIYALKGTTLVAASSRTLQAKPISMSRKSQQPEACVRAAGLLGL